MKRYKTFWRRFFASLIDSLIFIPITSADFYLDVSNKYIFIFWISVSALTWLIYSIYFHGKYGQTIGKKILGIKVLDIDEIKPIGYRRALFRDSIYIVIEFGAIIYFIKMAWSSVMVSESLRIAYEDIFLTIAILWLLIELITMVFNSKRRAIHDFLAGSVVVKIK